MAKNKQNAQYNPKKSKNMNYEVAEEITVDEQTMSTGKSSKKNSKKRNK